MQMRISINNDNYTRLNNDSQQKNYQNSEVFKFTTLCQKIFELTGNLKQKGPSRVMQVILREILVVQYTGGHNVTSSKSYSVMPTGLFTSHIRDMNKILTSNTKSDHNIYSLQKPNSYFADALKMSIRQIQRITKHLSTLGIITITYHPIRGMNTYTINPLLLCNEIKIALRHLIPALNDTWLESYCKSKGKNKQNESEREISLYYKKEQKKLDRNRINNWTLAGMDEAELKDDDTPHNPFSITDFQKMSPFSNMNNIYTRARTCEADDGVSMAEPDWLVEAGKPIVSTTASALKKEGKGKPTREQTSPSSLFILKKSSNEQPQTGDSMKHETLYTKNIIAVADSLKSIRPTIWGQIKMAAYPDEAILYADKRLLNSRKKINNRFSYFMTICKAYCEENKLKINWSYSLKLGDQYSMPLNGPWIDENFQPFGSDNSTQIMSKNKPIRQLLSDQWKDERVDLDREKELLNAKDELEKMANHNPFAAILFKGACSLSVEKKDSSKVKYIDVLIEPNIAMKYLPVVELMNDLQHGNPLQWSEYEDDPFGDRH